ncbi:MAG: FAD-dependent oxidoreductase [Thermodesulfobacteriota bacterium]
MMKRDLNRLADNVYDVLVIGGGIYGVFAAWDAILRGLSVALVEKGDFGHATSSNSLRIIHGGIRYLQSLDIRRARQSMDEQLILKRIAPHLIKPLPFLIPTYGHLMRGKELLYFAISLYKLIGFDRNLFGESSYNLPIGRTISREECIQAIPDIDSKGLTGGVIFYDCQVPNAERLIMAVARSAANAGADMANYVEVNGFAREKNRVVGVKVKDVLNGDGFEIRTKNIINTCGPWLNNLLSMLDSHYPVSNHGLSKAFNLLLNRNITNNYAVGIYSHIQNKGTAQLLGRKSRYLYITPWNGRSLLGTEHLQSGGDPDNLQIHKDEMQTFLEELSSSYPAAGLKLQDISFVYAGLLPTVISRKGNVRLSSKYKVYDHGREQGLEGLISVRGVKFTEARYVAERVVDLVFTKLNRTPSVSYTRKTPVHGGDIEGFSDYLSKETIKRDNLLTPEILHEIICDYGTAYPELLKYLTGELEFNEAIIDKTSLIKPMVIHAVREEMAQKLSDVIFRRTNMGMDGYATGDNLKNVARIMAKELNWNRERLNKEINDATGKFFHLP